MTGERSRFGSDPFLHTTVPGETDDLMVKNRVIRGIEPRCRHFLGDRHPHRVPDSLAERSSRALDSRGLPKLGMTRRFAMQLPEVANIIHRNRIAGQMEPGI